MIEILKQHRFEQNPKEKQFVDDFLNDYSGYNTMDLIVFGHASTAMQPKDFLSEREKSIVLSTIQWLGSPVGQGFLEKVSTELTQLETK